MIQEIRIYYESLEQAENYIKPLILNALAKLRSKTEIKLVKCNKNNKCYSANIAPIIFWKDPDILLTYVNDKIEYPLLSLEFSTAVFTEDHELQRFDGLVACAENNCVYAKISPLSKKSPAQHGGNTDFDYTAPFALIYKRFGKLFYHFDWECDDRGIVIVDENYFSCPKKMENFNYFIEVLVEIILDKQIDRSEIVRQIQKRVVENSKFAGWEEKIKGFIFQDIKKLNTSRTIWNGSSNELILKLNRFGHAMDPERGMLAYYGIFHDKVVSKMCFDEDNNAWYRKTPKEKEISDYINSFGLIRAYDYLEIFTLASGLYQFEDFIKIKSSLKANKDNYVEIDLTKFLEKNYKLLNKPLRTIIKYSSYFLITDKRNNNRLKFLWSRFNKILSYGNFSKITEIHPTEEFSEDDVTYITVHNILKQNGYKIVSVSYPGAQGDRAILPEAGTGRSQERKYVDVISYLPGKHTALQENKGPYSAKAVQEDIYRLSIYKDTKTAPIITSFINRYDKSAPKIIKIGVGFWANKKFSVSSVKDLDIKDLDYFIYITSDRKEWIIWSADGGDMFKIKKGNIKMPQIFDIDV